MQDVTGMMLSYLGFLTLFFIYLFIYLLTYFLELLKDNYFTSEDGKLLRVWNWK